MKCAFYADLSNTVLDQKLGDNVFFCVCVWTKRHVMQHTPVSFKSSDIINERMRDR